jgi:glutathione S-transferase
MKWVSIVAVLSLIQFLYLGLQTGQARQKYNIKAPATTGDPTFERYFRVQQNTLEQLVIFIPSLFLFATYVRPGIAAILGLVFIAGRVVYARSYVADPEKRSAGFGITFVPNVILLLGGLIGAFLS